MNELAWIGAAVGGVLLASAAVATAWRQHRQLAALGQRLARLEQARVSLERHARETDERLDVLTAAPPTPAPMPAPVAAPPAGDEAALRRRLLEEALARADAAAAATVAQGGAPVNWRDTEPLPLPDTCYAPTLPMELHPEARSFGAPEPQRRRTVRP